MFDFEDPLGAAVIALFLILVFYSVFQRITYYFKPYHKRKRELAKLKTRTHNIMDMQQLHLEQEWLKIIANRYSIDKNFASQNDDFTIFSKIPADLLLLPSVHNLINEQAANLLFHIIQEHTANAIINNAHYKAGCAYIPMDILPFPLDYTVFALDYRIANELFYKIDTEEAISRSKAQKRAIYRVLTNHIVNVRSELLPINLAENERVGKRTISNS